MKHKIPSAIIATLGLAAAGWLMTATNMASAATTHATPQLQYGAASTNPVAKTHTVTTFISLQPDSAVSGDTWGQDTFTQLTTITRSGGTRGYEYVNGTWQPYPVADCGGGARCFRYTFSMKLAGHTTTVAGQVSPGDPAGGTLLDVAENVRLAGTTSGVFFSSYKRYYDAQVPTRVAVNEITPVVVDGYNTTNNYGFWAVLGQGGAHIASVTMPDWSFTYTAAKGADSQCPGYSGTWTDAASGSTGNVLAPDTADCASQS